MDLSKAVKSASKWSIITEVVTKLIAPVINMVLARLLTPEAFGMVATITMITSFADLFSDAGFQKYLVQKEFATEDELEENTNVAFWINISISFILWLLIFIFRNQLATFVGNSGLGDALAVSALSLLLTSFSSIQLARFRRDLDFKTMFWAKLVGILVPIVITIPLAFVLRSFWALVIGTLCVNIANAFMLTLRSKWKPKLYFNTKIMNDMLSFSLWTLFEQLLGWANLNVGIFIVGNWLSEYYLGLYKTSMATSNQIFSIIINALSPVLLSSLSKIKTDVESFSNFFYLFEERIALIVLPLGIGIFVYQNLFTKILLGSQWAEAASFIGLWGLLRALWIVYGMFSMEVFVSLGRPQISVIGQCLEILVLLPTLLYSAKLGYEAVCTSRACIIILMIIIELLLLRLYSPIRPSVIIKSCMPYLLSAIIMGTIGSFVVRYNDSVVVHFFSIFISIVVYFLCINSCQMSRTTLKNILNDIKW